MTQDTPTGIPFLYEKSDSGDYSRKFATSRKDYSKQSLDFLNWISFDEMFRKNESEFYTMRCVINGEKRVQTPEGTFRVDGYVETSDTRYCLEFYGCSVGLKNSCFKFILFYYLNLYLKPKMIP